MPQSKPRLRGKKQSRNGIYPIGEFPRSLINEVARRLVYLYAVGRTDLSGNDWASCFAGAVGGEASASNLDTCDVSFENCAWSAKTVKAKVPSKSSHVRLISGRNSPTYSRGIDDPFKNKSATGRAVLEIWNERVNRVLSAYEDFRLVVLVRNFNTLQFAMFETEITRFVPSDYKWTINDNRNFEGYDASTGQHCFTWQPHGDKFTIIRHLPASAQFYEIKRPPTMDFDEVIKNIGFNASWVKTGSQAS
ncbi:MAG: hypothetical protein MPK06_06240 [Alphaproteobacteria bacterium]|nr:hypothetical protein [Alphaproteobacteria bacterium]MDA8004012.1 hypothetical protein [Alphaproteobacteria bacterium]MDA8006119.1 hypothetical protein [Alphaproteobacteria bacterium]MDA8012876.1 hypothetical protein [Alphaproteobacteria bacterium]